MRPTSPHTSRPGSDRPSARPPGDGLLAVVVLMGKQAWEAWPVGKGAETWRGCEQGSAPPWARKLTWLHVTPTARCHSTPTSHGHSPAHTHQAPHAHHSHHTPHLCHTPTHVPLHAHTQTHRHTHTPHRCAIRRHRYNIQTPRVPVCDTPVSHVPSPSCRVHTWSLPSSTLRLPRKPCQNRGGGGLPPL